MILVVRFRFAVSACDKFECIHSCTFQVVCGNCSNFRSKLEYDESEKEHRVCCDCIEILTTKATNISAPELVSRQPKVRGNDVLNVKASDTALHFGS